MLLVAGNCLFTGCAHMEAGRHTQFTIKVVDEKNNQPVPGVSAVWREDLDDLIFGHFQIGPTNLQPSDDAGIIKIIPARGKMIGRLILSRPGGFMLYCGYASGKFAYSRDIVSTEVREAVWTNGCFVFPMPSE